MTYIRIALTDAQVAEVLHVLSNGYSDGDFYNLNPPAKPTREERKKARLFTQAHEAIQTARTEHQRQLELQQSALKQIRARTATQNQEP
jgi:hypothetical protein